MLQGAKTLRRLAPRMARTYAEASGGLKLTFALPRTAFYQAEEVTQVNLPTTAGAIGVLASHVPTVEELVPGVVEVITGQGSKQFFVAGGFASVSPDSELNVNAIEAFPLEELSGSEAKSLLASAQKNAASSDENVAAIAKVEVEVFEALAGVAKA